LIRCVNFIRLSVVIRIISSLDNPIVLLLLSKRTPSTDLSPYFLTNTIHIRHEFLNIQSLQNREKSHIM
jgi:hypothetical protein